jgi:hypothetical protein
MKLQVVLAGAFAVLAFAGCSKEDTPAPIKHIIGEGEKATQEAELRAHKYVSACDSTNLLWKAGGVNSSNVVYDFQNGDAGKTIQFFSAKDCNSATLVGQATYSGTQDIGGEAAEGSRTLDLNYLKVVITISNQGLVDSLNGGIGQIQNCGINDWAVGAGRDVTASSGGANCEIVGKPAQSFDIVETDGQTTFFGLKDAGHNALTQEARPVHLDKANGYSKM